MAKTIPPGNNPDGFFVLSAVDAVDPNPQIFILDTGSGTVFGPFASGTRIKYTESPDGIVEIKPMGTHEGFKFRDIKVLDYMLNGDELQSKPNPNVTLR